MKLYCAIDIGADGAFARIYNGVLKYGKLPVDKARELDPVQLYGLLFDGNILEEDTLHCVIEDLRSVHGSSASSNFSYGFNNGSVVTFLKAYQIPFTRISPKQWQKLMWQGVPLIQKIDGKKKNKDGTQKMKTDTKAMSLVAAQRIFPNESFLATERSSVPHDGLVDAALICEFGKRMNY